MAKILIGIGCVFILLGLYVLYGGSLSWLGKLPGDFSYKREHVQIYLPLGTCFLLSVLVSLVLKLWRH